MSPSVVWRMTPLSSVPTPADVAPVAEVVAGG